MVDGTGSCVVSEIGAGITAVYTGVCRRTGDDEGLHTIMWTGSVTFQPAEETRPISTLVEISIVYTVFECIVVCSMHYVGIIGTFLYYEGGGGVFIGEGVFHSTFLQVIN